MCIYVVSMINLLRALLDSPAWLLGFGGWWPCLPACFVGVGGVGCRASGRLASAFRGGGLFCMHLHCPLRNCTPTVLILFRGLPMAVSDISSMAIHE